MKNYLMMIMVIAAALSANQYMNDEIQYIFPQNNSDWILPKTPIIIRFKNIDPLQIENLSSFINVHGEQSGLLTGRTVISSDQHTIIFYPNTPFVPEDKVSVEITPQVVGEFKGFLNENISFTVARKSEYVKPAHVNGKQPFFKKGVSQYNANKDGVVILNGVSVPSDFPYVDITINDNPDDGYIFCNYEGFRNYNLILDNNGDPVFYWIVPDSRRDFKVQPNGQVTMTVRQGFGGGGYIAVDNTYAVVDTFFVPDGYTIDEHELLLLENGHYLVTALDTRIVDMSKLVAGGKKDAQVIGYHLLEMDEKDNPVFIWRCWDHYEITDAEYVDLTQRNIDFLHTNSIAVDLDENYLICPKLLNEITKIDRNTGDIIWRLGGSQNEFEYIGFDDFIYMQHSIRVLPNGNYMVFDNGNYHQPHFSRALEFRVDEENMTVTKVWEFRDTPDKQSFYKGNVQRLPNGNTLINWGMQYLPKLTEVRPNGSKAFEMNFEDPVQCYRVFRFPWQANAYRPFLVVEEFSDRVTLLFNKFGDPDVKEYRVYGGADPNPQNVIKTTSDPYVVLDENYFTASNTYYFRVTAVDSKGNESEFSNEEKATSNFIPINQELIRNGDFNSNSQWTFDVSGSASAVMNTNNAECEIDITQGGQQIEDVSLQQGNLTLYSGQTYVFAFDAWADKSQAIEAAIESSFAPYMSFSRTGLIAVSRERKTFEYTFTMESATTKQARLVFNIGGQTGTLHFDNVSLVRTWPADVQSHEPNLVADFKLNAVYPNPFNSQTNISFSLAQESDITIDIFDVLGRTVDVIAQQRLTSGNHTMHYDASQLVSGVYFCRVKYECKKSGKWEYATERMLVIK